MFYRLTGFIFSLVVLVAPSFAVRAAQEKESPASGANSSVLKSTASAMNVGSEETKILASIHHANMMEIDMGNVAADNAESDEVRRFGERLVQDHKDADKRVMDLSKQLNVALPDEDEMMGEKDRAAVQKLKSMKAAEFDAAFAKMMVSDHRKDIQMLKASLPKLENAPTKTLVTDVLGVIQEHERIASKLAANPSQRMPKQPS